ncbi:MAG: efflux RND transporter periplasmic adaptor subunit [Verrucomicrobiota bacterium]
MKSLIGILVLLLLLGGGGYYGFQYWEKQKVELAENEEEDLSAPVSRQTIELNVEVSGDIEPLEQVEVKAEVSAKLKKIHVELGQRVKRGDLLFELDDQELLTQLESAKLEIESARLGLEKALSDHQRNERLFKKELIPARDVADSLTDKQLAENAVERAQKRLQNVQDKLDKTQVLAPISGMILEMPVVEGQVVVAAASVNSGTLLMKLADLSNLIIKTHINQIDVAKLKPKMDFKFFMDPLPGETFEGKIHTIAPTATVKRNVKGFAVEMIIPKPDARLKPGMTANVVVPIEVREGVLSVPLAAVFSESDRSKIVYIRSNTIDVPIEKRPVEIGVANLDFVEITSGLTEGEVVMLTRPKKNKKDS